MSIKIQHEMYAMLHMEVTPQTTVISGSVYTQQLLRIQIEWPITHKMSFTHLHQWRLKYKCTQHVCL